jgi:hypothetical protein
VYPPVIEPDGDGTRAEPLLEYPPIHLSYILCFDLINHDSDKEIDVKVYDECADSDCSGCCTRNARPSGYLIDVEKYTAQRFGVEADGEVEWRCLDCD